TIVHPAPGFNVIACANTKGKGSNDGRFIGANVLNEAFLERFAITVEQDYPNIKIETKILENNFQVLGLDLDKDNNNFIKCQTRWAEQVRKTYNEGGVDEVISTRRLVHIAKAFGIFKNRKKALQLCLNRFDDEVKTALLDIYFLIDKQVDKEDAEAVAATERAKNPPVLEPGGREGSGTTNVSQSGSNSESDIEFIPVAAELAKIYNTNVKIQVAGDPATGRNTILVFSHGTHNSEFECHLPNINTDDFYLAMCRMVEANMATKA
ncbi:MAG: hypothetical protein ACREQ5_15920, partial [Candidatus Dormibacteria bacterium]